MAVCVVRAGRRIEIVESSNYNIKPRKPFSMSCGFLFPLDASIKLLELVSVGMDWRLVLACSHTVLYCTLLGQLFLVASTDA